MNSNLPCRRYLRRSVGLKGGGGIGAPGLLLHGLLQGPEDEAEVRRLLKVADGEQERVEAAVRIRRPHHDNWIPLPRELVGSVRLHVTQLPAKSNPPIDYDGPEGGECAELGVGGGGWRGQCAKSAPLRSDPTRRPQSGT